MIIIIIIIRIIIIIIITKKNIISLLLSSLLLLLLLLLLFVWQNSFQILCKTDVCYYISYIVLCHSCLVIFEVCNFNMKIKCDYYYYSHYYWMNVLHRI